jgi:hypothetical protein
MVTPGTATMLAWYKRLSQFFMSGSNKFLVTQPVESLIRRLKNYL